MGKLYNYSGDLIFDGEFLNGEQIKGNINKYNNQCELIYKKEGGKYKKLKSLISYNDNIMIKNCIWIMEVKQNNINEYGFIFMGEYKEGKRYKGKECKYNGDIIFDGEYKDGKRYKGKEYNNNGDLIFEGEYKDGNYYNGKKKNIIIMVI